MFQVWPDCLNFKHWPILSSASGALLIFTVKSTLKVYSRVTAVNNKKKKKKKKKQTIRPRSDAIVWDIWSGRTRVWELFYQIWDRQTVLIKTKKKRKKTGAFKWCILLSLSVNATFDLLDTPTAPGCFAVSVHSHVSHKWINYQTTVTDDSC